LFIFSHTQYLTFNAYSAAKLPTLLLIALGSGVVFARTRSLVPSIIAHAIGNVPMTPFWQGVVVVALIIGTVMAARRGTTVVRQVFSGATVNGCVGLGVIGTAYAIASARVEGLVFVAAVMVVLAIVLEAVDRGQEPADIELAVG